MYLCQKENLLVTLKEIQQYQKVMLCYASAAVTDVA